MFEEETKFLAGAKEKLKLLTLDLEAKDAEVLRLTASNALIMKTNTRPSTKDASNKSRRMVNWGSTHNQAIVEDSQPAETVKSAAHQENFADSTPHSQISSLGDLSGLFPPTPVLSSQDLDTSKNNSQKTSGEPRDVRDEPFSSNRKPVVLYDKQEGSHRREQLENQTNGQKHSMLPRNTSSLRQPDQPRVDSVQLHEPGSKIGPSYTASGKSASKVTNSEKRRALIAGLDKDSRPSKRSNTATTRGLGPIIPDSQTPNGSRMLPSRGRKLSKGLIPGGLVFYENWPSFC